MEDKIRQFVDLCSISNVSGKCDGHEFLHVDKPSLTGRICSCSFLDLCASVIAPLFWLLHPWAFRSRTRRHKHGGNEQQPEERGGKCSLERECAFHNLLPLHCTISPLSFSYFKESLCGQRGLLPNTDIQTFQVSLATHVRSHYDRIREPFFRVSFLPKLHRLYISVSQLVCRNSNWVSSCFD